MPIRRWHGWAAVCGKHKEIADWGDGRAIAETRKELLEILSDLGDGRLPGTQEEAIRSLCDKCREERAKRKGA